MTPRATPMSADDRRDALIGATIPLLLEHGTAVTTKHIAEAAGVAEGTIFRVFATKDELVDAALQRAFDLEPFVAELEGIDPDQSLADVVPELVARQQARLRDVFALMTAVGMVGPQRPKQAIHPRDHELRELVHGAYVRLVAPHADELSVPVDHFVHVLHLLTFAGSHPRIAYGRTLSPEEIATVVLHGLLKED